MSEEIQYRITKEQCEKMSDGKVCSCCGKPVAPIETVDNSNNPTYWAGCKDCNRFDFGVTPFIFSVAKEMVDNQQYIPYGYLGVKENHPQEEWPEWYRSQYSGACSHVRAILQVAEKLKTK